ncbi:phospho-sugar mutase [bacterium]|nr:phospho-sugar mutase [bacterium]
MTTPSIDPEVLRRAQEWLDGPYDEASKQEVRQWMEQDPRSLTDAFYTDLDFGTGGLRGVMGTGSSRVNRYTLGMATQGLANYLNAQVDQPSKSVAISHDSRHNSRDFAEQTAAILAANGIDAYLFSELRPTPLLSFAIRNLGCDAGVMITASHNPPEYNGYKVYWNDGGQLVPPHDKGVIAEVRKVKPTEIRTSGGSGRVREIGAEVERAYLDWLRMSALSHAGKQDLKLVFTSLHGTGITVLPKALSESGFTQVHLVASQSEPDGSFPTVESPNPEEAGALAEAVRLAESVQADMVIGTDPDADRVGIAVRDFEGRMRMLNGNEAAAVLVDYLLEGHRASGSPNEQRFIASTIVTTQLLPALAEEYGVECPQVLTGFKWIAELIRLREGRQQFIGGGEESYGYLVGDAVRDKDAIGSAVFLAEIAAKAKAEGSSFYGRLVHLWLRHGLYLETGRSLTLKGQSGAQEIALMMQGIRENPPAELDGSRVVEIRDYQSGTARIPGTTTTSNLGLPASNVVQLRTEDGTLLTARPSGTEPKIKFYLGLKAPLGSVDAIDTVRAALLERARRILDRMAQAPGT